ncbi:DUF2075 domain-containing protein [Chitinophaga sp. MM2321]|uniref:DUF2075 domain-containing protein n=1 Tax=Chitinophaga sp. MM2321 TaxID=3137178 RepID=UPI0032D56FA1
MIVYQEDKQGFGNDLLTNDIENIIARQIKLKTGKSVAPNELKSYKNSLVYMGMVLNDHDIPNDCGISIEYHLPQTSKRADFIITGSDGDKENVVIVELKQWSEAHLTEKDGIVETQFKGNRVPTSHPSYQAWSYAALLQSFNATIEEESIVVQPCAYLHNYEQDDVITNEFYSYYIEKAPVFLKKDAIKLREFIKKFMKYGDKTNIIAKIDNGKIRPSKSLADSLKSLIKGNKEFIMIDDQKVTYETALHLAQHSNEKNKNVLIVEGGPGTGKSVVAINLLVELNHRGLMTQYVTKTLAPRSVYFDKLRDVKRMTELRNLFVGSGTFMQAPQNAISTLIVDEAHRLTEKTGFLRQGDNQVKEIINTATCSIFFIDEDQRVHFDDYADIQIIEEFAIAADAKVHRLTLSSQFRCNGSDGYLAWLDDVLQIRNTANESFDSIRFAYDFKIVDSPAALYNIIAEKNKINNKARLVAGYCWDWNSKRKSSEYDIIIPEHNFRMKWNFMAYESAWIIDPRSIDQVGCIHTCQGLDVDYIGVIIGKDLIAREGQVLVDPSKRSKDDKSISGYKKMLKEHPEKAKKLVRTIIKNTYRTLMTRGMKGCYIYCEDKELENYLKDRLNISITGGNEI